MKKFIGVMMVLSLLLAACGKKDVQTSDSGSVSDGEKKSEYGTIDHGVDENQVGFNMTGGTIEEASGVPADEKERILEVFNKYISLLNEQDIEGYLNTLSPKRYDIEEERKIATDYLSTYSLVREVSNTTIVKYTDTEVQVFANLKNTQTELSTGLVTEPTGRQVTVLKKEDDEWKVSSVHVMGDQ